MRAEQLRLPDLMPIIVQPTIFSQQEYDKMLKRYL